jgi:hypothetical protein
MATYAEITEVSGRNLMGKRALNLILNNTIPVEVDDTWEYQVFRLKLDGGVVEITVSAQFHPSGNHYEVLEYRKVSE